MKVVVVKASLVIRFIGTTQKFKDKTNTVPIDRDPVYITSPDFSNFSDF